MKKRIARYVQRTLETLLVLGFVGATGILLLVLPWQIGLGVFVMLVGAVCYAWADTVLGE